MKKEELLEKSLKRELSDSLLRTRLNVILSKKIENFGLRDLGIIRLEDLLFVKYKDLVTLEETGKIKALNNIRYCVHHFGCTLNGEYEELDITDREALIPITALDINTRVKHSLIRNGRIYCLGDLLSVDATYLSNIRTLGEKGRNELISYLEELGYDVESLKPNINDRKQELRENGEVLVDDVVGSRKVMLALNRAGIYSLDQLLAIDDVHNIPGIGNIMSKVVIDSLRNLDLSKEEIVDAGNEVLANLTEEKNKLRMRKAALLVEQAEIDDKLRKVNASINKISGGSQYGKK